MVRYDSSFIYSFADQLETKARIVLVWCTVATGLIGTALGYGFATQANLPGLFCLIGTLIGGFIGFAVGADWAFRIRLALHTMLCQVQIEENTRALRLDRQTEPPFAIR